MTNFHLLSTASQLALAERIAANELISLEEAFTKLNLASADDKAAFDKLQEVLKAEVEKAKLIFNSDNIQSDFDKGHLSNVNDLPDDIKNFDPRLISEFEQAKENAQRIADNNKIEEFRDAEFDENFRFTDAFGNVVVRSDEGFVFKNSIDGILNVSQQGFIQQAQAVIFANALAKGRYRELGEDDKLTLATMKENLAKLKIEKRNIEVPILLEIKKLEEALKELRNQQRAFNLANPLRSFFARLQRGRSQSSARRLPEQLIINAKRSLIDATNIVRTRITITTGNIKRLENSFFTFDTIEDFRRKIIDDIESFRSVKELTNTDILILQELVNQGSQFLENVLNKRVTLSQDKVREIQLAIVEAIQIQKLTPRAKDDLFDVFGEIRNKNNNLANNQVTVNNDINDFLAGIGEFVSGSGEALANALDGLNKAFTPDKENMTEMFVNAALAQKDAAKILQGNNN